MHMYLHICGILTSFTEATFLGKIANWSRVILDLAKLEKTNLNECFYIAGLSKSEVINPFLLGNHWAKKDTRN